MQKSNQNNRAKSSRTPATNQPSSKATSTQNQNKSFNIESLPSSSDDALTQQLINLREENTRMGKQNQELSAKLHDVTSYNQQLGLDLYKIDQEISELEEKLEENKEKTKHVREQTNLIIKKTEAYKTALSKNKEMAELARKLQSMQKYKDKAEQNFIDIEKLLDDPNFAKLEESCNTITQKIHFLYWNNHELNKQLNRLSDFVDTSKDTPVDETDKLNNEEFVNAKDQWTSLKINGISDVSEPQDQNENNDLYYSSYSINSEEEAASTPKSKLSSQAPQEEKEPEKTEEQNAPSSGRKSGASIRAKNKKPRRDYTNNYTHDEDDDANYHLFTQKDLLRAEQGHANDDSGDDDPFGVMRFKLTVDSDDDLSSNTPQKPETPPITPQKTPEKPTTPIQISSPKEEVKITPPPGKKTKRVHRRHRSQTASPVKPNYDNDYDFIESEAPPNPKNGTVKASLNHPDEYEYEYYDPEDKHDDADPEYEIGKEPETPNYTFLEVMKRDDIQPDNKVIIKTFPKKESTEPVLITEKKDEKKEKQKEEANTTTVIQTKINNEDDPEAIKPKVVNMKNFKDENENDDNKQKVYKLKKQKPDPIIIQKKETEPKTIKIEHYLIEYMKNKEDLEKERCIQEEQNQIENIKRAINNRLKLEKMKIQEEKFLAQQRKLEKHIHQRVQAFQKDEEERLKREKEERKKKRREERRLRKENARKLALEELIKQNEIIRAKEAEKEGDNHVDILIISSSDHNESSGNQISTESIENTTKILSEEKNKNYSPNSISSTERKLSAIDNNPSNLVNFAPISLQNKKKLEESENKLSSSEFMSNSSTRRKRKDPSLLQIENLQSVEKIKQSLSLQTPEKIPRNSILNSDGLAKESCSETFMNNDKINQSDNNGKQLHPVDILLISPPHSSANDDTDLSNEAPYQLQTDDEIAIHGSLTAKNYNKFDSMSSEFQGEKPRNGQRRGNTNRRDQTQQPNLIKSQSKQIYADARRLEKETAESAEVEAEADSQEKEALQSAELDRDAESQEERAAAAFADMSSLADSETLSSETLERARDKIRVQVKAEVDELEAKLTAEAKRDLRVREKFHQEQKAKARAELLQKAAAVEKAKKEAEAQAKAAEQAKVEAEKKAAELLRERAEAQKRREEEAKKQAEEDAKERAEAKKRAEEAAKERKEKERQSKQMAADLKAQEKETVESAEVEAEADSQEKEALQSAELDRDAESQEENAAAAILEMSSLADSESLTSDSIEKVHARIRAQAKAEVDALEAQLTAEARRELRAKEKYREEQKAKARAEVEAQYRQKLDAKTKELEKALAEAEKQAQQAEQAKSEYAAKVAELQRAQIEAEEKARLIAQAEAQTRAELEAKARELAQFEAETRAKAEAQARAEQEAKENREKERQARQMALDLKSQEKQTIYSAEVEAEADQQEKEAIQSTELDRDAESQEENATAFIATLPSQADSDLLSSGALEREHQKVREQAKAEINELESFMKAEARRELKAKERAKEKAKAQERLEAEKRAQILAEAQERAEAAERQAQAEARARAEAERKVAEALAKAQQAEQLAQKAEQQALAEAQARAEAEAKALAETQARAEAEAKAASLAKQQAEAKIAALAKARADAQARKILSDVKFQELQAAESADIEADADSSEARAAAAASLATSATATTTTSAAAISSSPGDSPALDSNPVSQQIDSPIYSESKMSVKSNNKFHSNGSKFADRNSRAMSEDAKVQAAQAVESADVEQDADSSEEKAAAAAAIATFSTAGTISSSPHQQQSEGIDKFASSQQQQSEGQKKRRNQAADSADVRRDADSLEKAAAASAEVEIDADSHEEKAAQEAIETKLASSQSDKIMSTDSEHRKVKEEVKEEANKLEARLKAQARAEIRAKEKAREEAKNAKIRAEIQARANEQTKEAQRNAEIKAKKELEKVKKEAKDEANQIEMKTKKKAKAQVKHDESELEVKNDAKSQIKETVEDFKLEVDADSFLRETVESAEVEAEADLQAEEAVTFQLSVDDDEEENEYEYEYFEEEDEEEEAPDQEEVDNQPQPQQQQQQPVVPRIAIQPRTPDSNSEHHSHRRSPYAQSDSRNSTNNTNNSTINNSTLNDDYTMIEEEEEEVYEDEEANDDNAAEDVRNENGQPENNNVESGQLVIDDEEEEEEYNEEIDENENIKPAASASPKPNVAQQPPIQYSPDKSCRTYSTGLSSEATLDQSELSIKMSSLVPDTPNRSTIESEPADQDESSIIKSPEQIKPLKKIDFSELEKEDIEYDTEINESELLDIPHEINLVNKMIHDSGRKPPQDDNDDDEEEEPKETLAIMALPQDIPLVNKRVSNMKSTPPPPGGSGSGSGKGGQKQQSNTSTNQQQQQQNPSALLTDDDDEADTEDTPSRPNSSVAGQNQGANVAAPIKKKKSTSTLQSTDKSRPISSLSGSYQSMIDDTDEMEQPMLANVAPFSFSSSSYFTSTTAAEEMIERELAEVHRPKKLPHELTPSQDEEIKPIEIHKIKAPPAPKPEVIAKSKRPPVPKDVEVDSKMLKKKKMKKVTNEDGRTEEVDFEFEEEDKYEDDSAAVKQQKPIKVVKILTDENDLKFSQKEGEGDGNENENQSSSTGAAGQKKGNEVIFDLKDFQVVKKSKSSAKSSTKGDEEEEEQKQDKESENASQKDKQDDDVTTKGKENLENKEEEEKPHAKTDQPKKPPRHTFDSEGNEFEYDYEYEYEYEDDTKNQPSKSSPSIQGKIPPVSGKVPADSGDAKQSKTQPVSKPSGNTESEEDDQQQQQQGQKKVVKKKKASKKKKEEGDNVDDNGDEEEEEDQTPTTSKKKPTQTQPVKRPPKSARRQRTGDSKSPRRKTSKEDSGKLDLGSAAGSNGGRKSSRKHSEEETGSGQKFVSNGGANFNEFVDEEEEEEEESRTPTSSVIKDKVNGLVGTQPVKKTDKKKKKAATTTSKSNQGATKKPISMNSYSLEEEEEENDDDENEDQVNIDGKPSSTTKTTSGSKKKQQSKKKPSSSTANKTQTPEKDKSTSKKELKDYTVNEKAFEESTNERLQDLVNKVREETAGLSNEALAEYLQKLRREIEEENAHCEELKRQLEELRIRRDTKIVHHFQLENPEQFGYAPVSKTSVLSSASVQTDITGNRLESQQQLIKHQEADREAIRNLNDQMETTKQQIADMGKAIEDAKRDSVEKRRRANQLKKELDEVLEEVEKGGFDVEADKEEANAIQKELDGLNKTVTTSQQRLNKANNAVSELQKKLDEMTKHRAVLESELDDLYNREKPEVRQLIQDVKTTRQVTEETTQKVNAAIDRINAKRDQIDQLMQSEEKKRIVELRAQEAKLTRRVRKWQKLVVSDETMQQIDNFSQRNAYKRNQLKEEIENKEKQLFEKTERVNALQSYANMIEAMLVEHKQNWT